MRYTANYFTKTDLKIPGRVKFFHFIILIYPSLKNLLSLDYN